MAVALPDNWEEELLRIAREMHEEKYPAKGVDQGMTNGTYTALNDGHLSGRNIKFGSEAGIDPAVMKMQQNIYRFSHAKTFTQLQEINSRLYDGNKKRSFEDFREEVKKVNDKYNNNYLQAEWQTANQAGHHARNWEQYQEQKHIFPNLKYMTVGDARVRDEHRALEGVIAPIDDPFWEKYYPPNGWRCRCYVVQTAELPSESIPQNVKEVKPEFQVNVGMTEQAFNEIDSKTTKAQPYFVIAKSAGGKQLEKAFELSKLSAPYVRVKTEKGRVIGVSPFADLKDLEANYKTANVVADSIRGIEINIRAHLDQKIVKTTNPEYEIDGKIADRKGNFKEGNYRAINSAFDEAKRQGLETVVFDFTSSFADLDITQVNRWIRSNVNEKRGKQYHEIIFVHKEKAVRASREQIVNNELREQLKKLIAEE